MPHQYANQPSYDWQSATDGAGVSVHIPRMHSSGSGEICDETCGWSNDGMCDDGGSHSISSTAPLELPAAPASPAPSSSAASASSEAADWARGRLQRRGPPPYVTSLTREQGS